MKDTVLVNKATLKNIYTPPSQSADTLFHFMDKLDYLLEIIEKDALIPRYCVETVDYLDIIYHEIAYPMLCFCDINLHKIDNHMSFYGGYGIAFSKQWGIEKGIQPIQYVNRYSHLKSDFTDAFETAINSNYTDKVQDFILTQMYFLKPIEGDMPRNGGIEHKNFTDECEWRYIPNVSMEKFPSVLTGSGIAQRKTLNDGIRYEEKLWLKFEVKDIKYIIIQNRKEFESVVDLILRKKCLSDSIKNALISKIIVWEESKGDF